MGEITQGIAWKDEYKLGYEQVDVQHYQLFVLLSQLVEACTEGGNNAKLGDTLDFLLNYTIHHFIDEEALQIRYNYPDYERHKQLHDDFKQTAREMAQHYEEYGYSTEFCIDVNKVLVKWLINHILREDKKIGDHIRNVTESA